MAEIPLKPSRSNSMTVQRGGGQQYYTMTAVKDMTDTAVNLTGWSAITSFFQTSNGNGVEATAAGTATGNADGTIDVVLSSSDLTAMSPSTSGSLVIQGVHVAGDEGQLLARAAVSFQN
jgi:hypothetical protein